MNRKAGFLLLLSLILVGAARPVSAQSNVSATRVSVTIWDGVYTSAQADRGARAVEQNCGACHSPTEWSNRFIASWSGRSIGELQTQIRTTMPFDSPGRLTAEQYADIVAYILRLNNVPAGERELPTEDALLNTISVTTRAGR